MSSTKLQSSSKVCTTHSQHNDSAHRKAKAESEYPTPNAPLTSPRIHTTKKDETPAPSPSSPVPKWNSAAHPRAHQVGTQLYQNPPPTHPHPFSTPPPLQPTLHPANNLSSLTHAKALYTARRSPAVQTPGHLGKQRPNALPS